MATFCTVGRCTMYDLIAMRSRSPLPTGTCDMPVIAFYRSDPRAPYICLYLYVAIATYTHIHTRQL